MKQEGKKTSISEIPCGNKQVLAETARLARTTKGHSEEVLRFIGEFVAGKIKEGNMHTIMLPYFGKFKPKQKTLLLIKMKQAAMLNGTSMIWGALKGVQNIKDHRDASLKNKDV
jgi:hypothetical protein